MTTPNLIAELPYRADSTVTFEALVDEPWSVLLDSGAAGMLPGRYDIMAADPGVTLVTRGGTTVITRRDGSCEHRDDDPFALLRAELGGISPPVGDLAFAGGAIGYFGYDLGRRLEALPAVAAADEDVPDMAVGIYDWAVVTDHDRQQTWLLGADRDPRTRERWAELRARLAEPPAAATRPPLVVTGRAQANLDGDAYRERLRRILAYLHAGDCYQVNFAQRFTVPATGDAWPAYRRMRSANPAPYGAWLSHPGVEVLSASPERFLRVDAEGGVETRPIKGTRPRAADPLRDRELAESLLASAKDRAENVMIVDLLRNDLGRVCRPGSVRVPRLFELESFPTVHHLVSTVTGTLAADMHALDLLRACFPGGSITGAPKIRAMEIIDELEPHRRGVYCGSIGYVGFDGAMDTNIAIRTLTRTDGRARFWAGGGIVIDSDPEQEYQESFDKAASMLALLEEIAAAGDITSPARGAVS